MPNNPYRESPELNAKDIGDPYVRTNFQNLKDYFTRQNQLLDFLFLEVIFTQAEDLRRVTHELGYIPRDLIRMEVSGTGIATFHRGKFTNRFLFISADGPVRLRFFVGNFYKSPVGPTSKADLIEQWWALYPDIPDPTPGGDGNLPVGGVAGDYLQKVSATDDDAEWADGTFEGFSARFGESFATVGLRETLLQILDFSYLAPTITLTSPVSTALREKGTTVASVGLTATTVKKSDDITGVTFYKNASLLYTVPTPSSGGGAESHTDGAGFSDTTSYFARVTDGINTVQSNTITFTEVYPYYYGVGAPGLSAASVGGLTKYVIANTATVARQFSPTAQVYYFAYPASYPALTSILDTNGFETIGDWSVSTGNITGLDGNAVSYRIYEFNNLTTQVNFTNTFKQ